MKNLMKYNNVLTWVILALAFILFILYLYWGISKYHLYGVVEGCDAHSRPNGFPLNFERFLDLLFCLGWAGEFFVVPVSAFFNRFSAFYSGFYA